VNYTISDNVTRKLYSKLKVVHKRTKKTTDHSKCWNVCRVTTACCCM